MRCKWRMGTTNFMAAGLASVLIVLGCSAPTGGLTGPSPTYTPYPTETPNPTATPYPTYTPYPKSVDQDSTVLARAHRLLCWSGRAVPTFHRSRAVSGPFPRPMAAAPSRVWELEQRLQKVCPLGGPWYLGTAASAFGQRPGSGISHHRQHRGTGPSLRRRSVPPKGGLAAQALGQSRGGFSAKVHVSVNALGNPLRSILTGGSKARHHPGPRSDNR